MTHFGALAAAASGRSPFVAVYPQPTAADNKPCPWYAAWATARVPHPSAIVGGMTAPDRPSPTGKHHFVLRAYMAVETKYTRGVQVLRSRNIFSGMEADRNVKVVGGDVAVL